MRAVIVYLIKLYFFWLLLFACNRLVFFAVEHRMLAGIPVNLGLAAFRYALPLDSSTACYSLAIPLLLLIAAYISGSSAWMKACRYSVLVLIFLHCATAYGEAALYTEWQTKLNYAALAHFANPSEVFRSASTFLIILFFGLTILLGLFYYWVYLKAVHLKTIGTNIKFPRRAAIGAALLAVLGFIIFTGIRGGWKRFPISLSISYYSVFPVLNDAAVNPGWNILHNLEEHKKAETHNPYHSLKAEDARNIVKELYALPKDTTVQVLTTTRPNILFFILESFTADGVLSGTHPAITPVLDSLIHNGIYFDSLYASGHVSDQGIPANLSAFPATSGISICMEPQKNVRLPSIVEELKKVGYHTGFLYGGQLDFGNLRGYVYNKKFDVVKDGHSLPGSLPRGALGIPDGTMADIVAGELEQAPSPFFYCWYTLSSHMPYDIPVPYTLHVAEKEFRFINAMHYTDAAIGLLLDKISRQPWFSNTLLVFVADHSHESQLKRTMQEKLHHRIPFLLYGDVIKKEWRGKIIHRISSQTDIVATLLKQLQLPAVRYPWSKNLFNPYTREFAAYNFASGTGFVTPEGYVALENQYPDFLQQSVSDTTLIPVMVKTARAYQQEAYRYFLNW